jgi:L-asparagine oxygenase
MSTALGEQWTTEVGRDDAMAAWTAMESAARRTSLASLGADDLAAAAGLAVAELPAAVLEAVYRYRSAATHGGALLLRGLLPGDVRFGRTPAESAAPLSSATVPVQAAGLYLLAVMRLLGEPFNFRSFYHGQLLQQVVPIPRMEHTQTGESSAGMLDWHVEDGFRQDRCDYFGLLCLRGEPTAVTRFAFGRDLELPGETVAVLREERFQMLPDTAHALADRRPTPTAVLSGPPGAPEICFDAHYLSARAGDDAAAHALAQLGPALDRVRRGHAMAAGDLLILDNLRAVHARTPFTPRYDGTDRWLMRTMVCASIPAYRRRGERIIN